jgi:hypothetical protein
MVGLILYPPDCLHCGSAAYDPWEGCGDCDFHPETNPYPDDEVRTKGSSHAIN